MADASLAYCVDLSPDVDARSTTVPDHAVVDRWSLGDTVGSPRDRIAVVTMATSADQSDVTADRDVTQRDVTLARDVRGGRAWQRAGRHGVDRQGRGCHSAVKQ